MNALLKQTRKKSDRALRAVGVVENVLVLESRVLMSLAGHVTGYMPDWEFGKFNQIDLSALSQINYFSVVANSSGVLGTTSASGYSFSQLTTVVTKAHAAGVLVAITIDPSSSFDAIAASSTATTAFANNLITFCSTYHLDGVDLDYEPGVPTQSQVTGFGNLIAALHPVTSAHGLSLSAAVEAANYTMPKADIGDLDWYNLMDYNLEYNSVAPYSDTITYLTNWTNYGVPKSKLLLGVPFYGTQGTSWSNSTSATYSQILNTYYNANGTYPAANLDSASGWQYNGVDTMEEKANYVLQNGYAGMMIWELGQDHFTSSGAYDQYSLLPAIKSVMNLPWMTASSGASFTYNETTLTVSSGTVSLVSDVSASVANLNVTVDSGATLMMTSSQHLGALTIAGGTVSFTATGTALAEVNSLAISGGGTLNLGTNDLVVHGGTLSQISGWVTQGLNLGSGYWNGTGITSSSAAGLTNTGLAVEVNNDGTGAVRLSSFDGQPVINTDVLVMYTYYGDADLSGNVTSSDYTLIDTGFNNQLTGWHNGDFNDDGVVNGNDYTLIDNAFNTQTTAFPAEEIAAASQPVKAASQVAAAVVNKRAVVVAPVLGFSAAVGVLSGDLFSEMPVGGAVDEIFGEAPAVG